MHYRSPGDIDYYTDAGVIANRVSQDEWLKGLPVLIYGKTSTPHYEVFLFVAEDPLAMPSGNQYVAYDTLLGDHYFYFVGVERDPTARIAVETDTRRMFESLVVGSDYNKEIASLFPLVRRFMTSNQYLNALERIRNYPESDGQVFSLKYQMMLTFSSFLGENRQYQELIEDFEARQPVRDDVRAILSEKGIPDQQALEAILQETRDKALVMINENHFYPRHRIFLLDLLPALKEQGFTHLAFEGLTVGEDSVLNESGSIPMVTTGFYAMEQQFNYLIREAKRLGFRFVAYESEGGDREANQANNLYAATFAQDDRAKVVVYAGLDHIFESSGAERRPRMAEIFKASYGIDPLTISQTQLSHYPTDQEVDYLLLETGDLPESYRMVDYQLVNHQPNSPRYPHVNRTFVNTYEGDVQVLHFYGDEIDNTNLIADHVPYFSTVVARGEEKIIPLITGQTTIRVIYDQFGNELTLRAIPDPADTFINEME